MTVPPGRAQAWVQDSPSRHGQPAEAAERCHDAGGILEGRRASGGGACGEALERQGGDICED